MKGTVITIALFLIVAHMLLLSGITDDVAGDSLDDFEGGVSENLPTDKDFNALAIGNLNGDEHLDIAFGGEDYGGANTQGLYAYAGNGGGSWTASYNGLPSEDSWGGLALGDADGDGKMELYAGNEGWGSHGGSVKGVGTWEYSGGSWSTSGISSPHPTKTVNDLKLLNFTKGPGLDVALTTSTGGDGGIRVYYGSGSSPVSWTANAAGLPTSGEFTGIDVRDLNNDGLPDIATVKYRSSGLFIFTQNSGGNGWTDCTTTLPSSARSGDMLGVTIGDCNNDGDADVIYSTRDDGMYILLGNGGGSSGGTAFSWTEPSGAFPTSATSGRFSQIQLADIDKDSDLDLLAPKANSGLRLYLGDGSEDPGDSLVFTEVTGKGLPTSGTFYGSIYLDFDDDGDLDVAGATWGKGVQVYRTSLSSTNEIPVAHAGDDLQVLTGESVILDGSGSSDPEDGDNIEYEWEVDGGNPSPVVLSDEAAVDPDFTAPDTPGNYTFTLRVKDTNDQWSDPDDVIVRVMNRRPVADAGDDLDSLTLESVTLNGSGSSDPEDGDTIEYLWNASDSNPYTVTLSDTTAISPSFSAPTVPGDYEFILKVRDTQGDWSDPDSMLVRIHNRPPLVDAGVDITRTVDSSVTLNGLKSSDPDGSVEHFNWNCTSHSVILDSPDGPFPSFVPDQIDMYVFTLSVQDDQGDWSQDQDTVNITVVAKGVNLDPSGDAGQDQNVHLGDTVTLRGDASSDPDGQIVTWEWNCTTHPGITATLQDPNSSRPSFLPDAVTTYTWTLRVRDDNGSWSPEDVVNITVQAVPLKPVADAGEDFTAVVDSTVTLDGSGSNDPDGFITEYTWICTSHMITLEYPGSPSAPTFVPTETGSYAFTLFVKDNDGINSVLDQVNITIMRSKENTAPIVNLTYPTGGEREGGDVVISWIAFDPEGDSMEYQIEISRDGGATYEVLREFVACTSPMEHHWPTDPSSFPNGALYRVRITVRDTNASSESSFAESGDLTIHNAPDDGPDEDGDDEGGFLPGFEAVFFIVILVIMSIRKRNDPHPTGYH